MSLRKAPINVFGVKPRRSAVWVIYRDGMANAGLRGVNWLMALFGLLVLAGSGVISVWALRAKKTIANTRTERGPPLRFGGWLVFLGLSQLVNAE